jgi:hypothetical protein
VKVSQRDCFARFDKAKYLAINFFALTWHVGQCKIPPLVAIVNHVSELVDRFLG